MKLLIVLLLISTTTAFANTRTNFNFKIPNQPKQNYSQNEFDKVARPIMDLFTIKYEDNSFGRVIERRIACLPEENEEKAKQLLDDVKNKEIKQRITAIIAAHLNNFVMSQAGLAYRIAALEARNQLDKYPFDLSLLKNNIQSCVRAKKVLRSHGGLVESKQQKDHFENVTKPLLKTLLTYE